MQLHTEKYNDLEVGKLKDPFSLVEDDELFTDSDDTGDKLEELLNETAPTNADAAIKIPKRKEQAPYTVL